VKGLQLLDLSRNELPQEGIAELQAVGVPLLSQWQQGSTRGAAPGDEALGFLMEGDYE
jgi:hypothetical protein